MDAAQLYDTLVSSDVPAEKARAVIDELEHDMGSTLATRQEVRLLKQDIPLLKQELEHRIDGVARDLARSADKVTRELEILRSSMKVRLGAMLAVAMDLLFATLKLTRPAQVPGTRQSRAGISHRKLSGGLTILLGRRNGPR